MLITQKPSASSSCLRCDIQSRRRVVQFSIYQNSVTRKRADQTAQILRLTSFQKFLLLDVPAGYWSIWIFWLVSFFCALSFGDDWFSAK